MKKLLFIVTMVFIFGCSHSNEKPSVAPTRNHSSPIESAGIQGEVESPILKMINVSLYSTKHPEKAQPMLVKVISEPNEIKEYVSKLIKNEVVELSIGDVIEVYYLQLEYLKSGVSEYKDILYAKTSRNKTYFKEFKMSAENNFDKFDDKLKDKLLQTETIGNKDWYLMSSQLPI
ncbi:hypothetical protein QFZ77_007542 [Paenibacillus sp. V4I3]|uniref:hypothetical protein n=1 Tax=Paenibacillus sp. V4I3 TaxID=3042305 RepID=UPI00277D7E03|nr:hypothetical protein [Paenibacillus sp. V4I3]MDQ0878883.1 hypothetical protein [Paenibacillus sp. V4I3]